MLKHSTNCYDQEDKIRNQNNNPFGYYSGDKIQTFVRVMSIVVSSVLPILSIIALYFINSQKVRLGCIVLFSAFCSIVLALVTDARNAEISGISAA